MKLIFRGHDDRYAVEQSLLAFFPDERPVYEVAAGGEDHALVSLHSGKIYTTATTRIVYQGKTARGVSRVVIDPALDEYESERLRQKAVKLSFFKAAREITGITPSWGALTGIRPGKIAARFLEEGKTEQQTDRILRDTYFVAPERRRLAIETAQAGLKAKAELKDNEISLYVGIPFCPTRCAYCSFVSASVEKSFGLMEPYLEVLHREIADAARMVEETGLKIKSFYMGGGTPTTLSAQQMDRLLEHLNRSFDLSGCVEYCIEAGRPDTIDRDKLQVLLDRGADRISVNPQSLEDHVLAAIGRKHSAADIERTMELVASMNFPHVNMDLIAGLPEDTPAGFRRTLDKCLSYGADNITVHTLALKKGSRILLEGSKIPTAEEVGAMLDYANPTLRAHGFAPYYLYRQKYMSGSFENVGWCISGAEGLYNIYIMEELHSILSLGAGGSTKMVDAKRGRIERVFHAKFPTEYIQRPEKLAENLSAFRSFHEEMLKR
ncbi:MAG: coproporphyrinogen dehydrogenase HemZ [Ruminococcaceae bacterium]|nr:coproporphyrinogen dehydrogenase HemZ [Oscillospiraceae bacterium]